MRRLFAIGGMLLWAATAPAQQSSVGGSGVTLTQVTNVVNALAGTNALSEAEVLAIVRTNTSTFTKTNTFQALDVLNGNQGAASFALGVTAAGRVTTNAVPGATNVANLTVTNGFRGTNAILSASQLHGSNWVSGNTTFALPLLASGAALTNLYGSNLLSGAWVSGLLGFDGSGNPVDVDTSNEFETAMGGVNYLTAPEITTSADVFSLTSDESGGAGVLLRASLSGLAAGQILAWSGTDWTNKNEAAGIAVAAGTNGITATTNGSLVTFSFSGSPDFLNVTTLNGQNLNATNIFTQLTNAPLLNTDADGKLTSAGGATPGGELGGTWASPTLDDNVTVTGWNLGASSATTPAENDNDTSVATTAYVQTELAGLGSQSTNLVNDGSNVIVTDPYGGTRLQIQRSSGGNTNFWIKWASGDSMINATEEQTPANRALSLYSADGQATLTLQGSAVTLTGNVTLPAATVGTTPSAGDDDTSYATTAFLKNELGRTNTWGNTALDFSRGMNVLTNMAGDLTIASVTGFTSSSRLNEQFWRLNPNGGTRILTVPSDWVVSGFTNGTTVAITNGTIVWACVTAIQGIETNIALNVFTP